MALRVFTSSSTMATSTTRSSARTATSCGSWSRTWSSGKSSVRVREGSTRARPGSSTSTEARSPKRVISPRRDRRRFDAPLRRGLAGGGLSFSDVTVTLRGPGMTEDQVVAVAREGAKVALAAGARQRMERSRARVERAASSRDPVYGVSTGFGALAGTRVAPLRQPELQLALIRSHAAGVGPPVEEEVVRATMLLRARTLAMGMSGVRPLIAEALIGLLNAGVTPLVPRYGSVGCSGDLAPLAHIGLSLVGEGDVLDERGGARPTAPALKAARLKPVKLETKEGLALINGTDGMLGMLVLASADAERLFRTADVTAAMSAEALLGTDRVFPQHLH